MSIDRWIQVLVEVNNTGVAREGFGLIGILSHKNIFPQKSRLYNSTAAMVSDGFGADSCEVRAATAIENQSPHPPSWLVLNGSAVAPTQEYQGGANTVANATAYSIDVDGEGVTPTTVTYTSGASAIRAQINAGLVGALNGVASKNYTAALAPLSFTAFAFTSNYPTSAVNFSATGHGMLTGDGPVELTTSGTLPAGLALATDYWIVKVDANTFQLATSQANALANVPVVVTTTTAGSGTFTVNPDTTLRPDSQYTVTGNAAGDWFSISVEDSTLINNAQIHADPGIAAVLGAIRTVDDSWFWLLTNFNSKLYVEAAAGWNESNGTAYIVDFVDTGAVNTAVMSATDGPAALFGLGYKATMYNYHNTPAMMMSAAFEGLLAPKNPGRWTAAFKTLSGVDPVNLTPGQEVFLEDRRCGSYETEAGRNITWDGEVANTVYGFFDVFVKLAFTQNDLQVSLFGVLVGTDVVGFTDEDLQLFQAAGNGVIARGVSDTYKIMAPGNPADPTNDPVPTFTVPLVADIDPSARALREVPDMQLAFRLQGAVQFAIPVTIVASF